MNYIETHILAENLTWIVHHCSHLLCVTEKADKVGSAPINYCMIPVEPLNGPHSRALGGGNVSRWSSLRRTESAAPLRTGGWTDTWTCGLQLSAPSAASQLQLPGDGNNRQPTTQHQLKCPACFPWGLLRPSVPPSLRPSCSPARLRCTATAAPTPAPRRC